CIVLLLAMQRARHRVEGTAELRDLGVALNEPGAGREIAAPPMRRSLHQPADRPRNEIASAQPSQQQTAPEPGCNHDETGLRRLVDRGKGLRSRQSYADIEGARRILQPRIPKDAG